MATSSALLKILWCSKDDAEDIFQEAILILCRKMEDSNFELWIEPLFYIQKTSKLLWFNQARKMQKQQTFHLEDDFLGLIDESELESEKEEKLIEIENAILEIGKQCQEILKLFYGKNLSMEIIAQKVGLRNEKVAKVQKYRCLNKVKLIMNYELWIMSFWNHTKIFIQTNRIKASKLIAKS